MECVLDLGNQVIAEKQLSAPEANRDTFTRLEVAGEIVPELAARLRAWAGFRNILVHQYLDIDTASPGTPSRRNSEISRRSHDGRPPSWTDGPPSSIRRSRPPPFARPLDTPRTRC